jgi:ComF family protein
MRERGYNQAQLLSQPIAARLGTDHITDNLIRMRPTQNQALLGKKDRWTNMRGAFKIKNVKPFSKKSVLLVDDLLTTGITASEAAYVLKEAGAARVGVFNLAIAL